MNHPSGSCQHPVGQALIVVIPAQGRIAAGGHHLKNTASQAQNRDVKGTTAQVVNGIDALTGVVEAIGNRRGCGLVDQAQYLQAGKLGCVLGRLALGIVEIGWHRDHSTKQIVAHAVLSSVAQGGQDISAYLQWRFFSLHRVQPQHARVVCKAVGQLVGARHIRQATPHETLDRGNRVFRVQRQHTQRLGTNGSATVGQVTHH